MRGRLLITLALDERTIDMMLDDELGHNFHDVGRHWHGFHMVGPCIGEPFSLGWIGRYGEDLMRPSLRCNWTQGCP
ncbi:hypothetical protein CQ12_00555 [Bradyrhizobium jicamae]|uniref:Uncharacterized protein n=1 Tax=Bradyrhizobium jicamae TaxID=280332 RepID=A0A0R3LHS9_9BRAD|nr:hypothetical protein CQ12_00555 [Bradyrhizobium jicamae]